MVSFSNDLQTRCLLDGVAELGAVMRLVTCHFGDLTYLTFGTSQKASSTGGQQTNAIHRSASDGCGGRMVHPAGKVLNVVPFLER